MTTSIVLSSLKPRINVRDRFGGLFFLRLEVMAT